MFVTIVRDSAGTPYSVVESRRPLECDHKLREAGFEPGAWQYVPDHGFLNDAADPITLLQLCAYTFGFRYGQASGCTPSGGGIGIVFRAPGVDEEYAPMTLERSTALIQATGDASSTLCKLLVSLGDFAVEYALQREGALA